MVRELNGRRPQIAPTAYVNESAYVVGNVIIGQHSSVWPGAVLRGDMCQITIGENTAVEDNCVIHGETDVLIGNDVIIGHGAVVHCRRIGNHVLIGNHAVILNDAEIGDFSIIGAASLITRGTTIPERSLCMGSPADIRGRVSPEKIEALKEGAAFYGELAQQYKKQGL